MNQQSRTLGTLRQAMNSAERDYILQVLNLTGGKIAPAARHAGMDRKTLRQRIRRHKIAFRVVPVAEDQAAPHQTVSSFA